MSREIQMTSSLVPIPHLKHFIFEHKADQYAMKLNKIIDNTRIFNPTHNHESILSTLCWPIIRMAEEMPPLRLSF